MPANCYIRVTSTTLLVSNTVIF
uniref:Uncharacterized protein n=1 Tax=Arundo donax TaxID=35708 RepID=A0A0A9A949_ARUDO